MGRWAFDPVVRVFIHLPQARWQYGALAALVLLGSCGSPDYAGTYVGHHPFGADTLVLHPDSTYYHSFRTLKGQGYVHRGRWSGQALKEFYSIDVENFDWHLPGYGGGDAQDTINSLWPAKLERSLRGQTYISIDDDLDYYYLKIK